MINSAVIIAVSSTNTRSKLREKRPRAMLPALGKPMVVRVMDSLYQAGIRHYVVIVGINEGQVAAYLNEKWMPDAKVEFILHSTESLPLLLSKIAHKLNRPFALAAYNSFTFGHFISSLFKYHEEFTDYLILSGALLSLSSDTPYNRYAVIDGDNVKTIISNRPSEKHFVLTEHAVCGEHFLHYLQNLDAQTAINMDYTWFQLVSAYLKTVSSKITLAETSWILRVEQDKDLLTLNKRLLEDSNDGHVLSELPYTAKIIPPVRIDPQVSVGQNAVIGPNVYIERGSSIGYGAKLKNTIVFTRSNIPADANIDNAIITSKGLYEVSN